MTARGARRLASGLAVVAAVQLGVATLIASGWHGRWDVIVFVPAMLAFAMVGALIAARRHENPVGWFFLALAVGGSLGQLARAYADHLPPLPGSAWAAWVFTISIEVPLPFMIVVLLVFPSGRFLSDRWRLFAVLCVGVGIAGALLTAAADVNLSNNFPDAGHPLRLVRSSAARPAYGAYQLTALMLLLVTAWGIVLRFRRSKGEERQQLKWFALAGTLAMLAFVAFAFLPLGIEPVLAFVLFVPLIPVATGVAILRHGLYDIDHIINRTLVYGALTVILAAVYVVGVVGLGSVLRSLSGQASGALVVAASTLAVAALFRPILRGVQSFVDRRFYRSRYDAGRTLEAFGSRLREELDLDALTGEVVDVVLRTMQPARVSLWLRGPGGSR